VELNGRDHLEQRFLHRRPDRRQFRGAGLASALRSAIPAIVEIQTPLHFSLSPLMSPRA
jgi:hypothetical protein